MNQSDLVLEVMFGDTGTNQQKKPARSLRLLAGDEGLSFNLARTTVSRRTLPGAARRTNSPRTTSPE